MVTDLKYVHKKRIKLRYIVTDDTANDGRLEATKFRVPALAQIGDRRTRRGPRCEAREACPVRYQRSSGSQATTISTASVESHVDLMGRVGRVQTLSAYILPPCPWSAPWTAHARSRCPRPAPVSCSARWCPSPRPLLLARWRRRSPRAQSPSMTPSEQPFSAILSRLCEFFLMVGIELSNPRGAHICKPIVAYAVSDASDSVWGATGAAQPILANQSIHEFSPTRTQWAPE